MFRLTNRRLERTFLICLVILSCLFCLGAWFLEKNTVLDSTDLIRNDDAHQRSSSKTVGSFHVEYPPNTNFYFMKRQGKFYHPAVRGVVCIAAVLRKHPIDGQSVWFLADFNVNRRYRGKNIGALFVATMVPYGYLRCRRMYALIMATSLHQKRYMRWWNYLLTSSPIMFYCLSSIHLPWLKNVASQGIVPRYHVDDDKVCLLHSRYTKSIYIDGKAQDIFHFVRDVNTVQVMKPHMISLKTYQQKELATVVGLLPTATIMIWLSQIEMEKILVMTNNTNSMQTMPKVWGEGILVHHGMRDDETFQWLDTIDL